jgi:hypothetical protein
METINKQNINFSAGFVTLAKKNHGDRIKKEVVDVFNRQEVPQIKTSLLEDVFVNNQSPADRISKPSDFVDKVNYFVAAAGKGSRFEALAQQIGDYNKVFLPFPLDKNNNLHMMDFSLALGKPYVGKNGYQTIISESPSGMLGDVINLYLNKPSEIKDTLIIGGDNVFGIKAQEAAGYFSSEINNPNKHIALLGIAKTPAEVEGRFGIMALEDRKSQDGILGLVDFVEKPPIDIAQKHAINGYNVANTGFAYISKEAMTNLIRDIQEETKGKSPLTSQLIRKNDVEVFDTANALKYIMKKSNEWFSQKPQDIADVKIINDWEDVGEPKAYFRFLQDLKKGKYLDNFSDGFSSKIKTATAQKVELEGVDNAIVFSDKYESLADVPKAKKATAKKVDGVKIIV